MVFYFTGTGNSLYVARELEDSPISIPQIMNSGSLEFTADKIGIVCPIYGHELPEMVKRFIMRARLCTDYLYLVMTYGARAASAAELAQTVFRRAGKRLDYIAAVLTVDNFLPAFDMDEQRQLQKNERAQLAKIRADIERRRVYLPQVTLQQRAMHEQYVKSVGGAAEQIWADFTVGDECIGCGICTRVCPVGCITLASQHAVIEKRGCQACYACIHACPTAAIRLNIAERNAAARYRNPNVQLCEIVQANNQHKL